jgi:ABC-2 type transport system ATP-binding protein
VGVVRPNSGSITVQGVDAIADNLEARRRIGYAPSETALYHRMTARGLLNFALAFHPDADTAQGRAMLERFEVPPHRRVRHLSHGMKRKVLLAQAIASGAPLLVLDEPMEALDPEARRYVEQLLRQAAADGRSVLFSSHDLVSTQRLCDHIGFLRQGEIIRYGAAAELAAEAGRVLHLVLRESRTRTALPDGPNRTWTGSGTRWTLVYEGDAETVLGELSSLPIAGIRDGTASLEEVFDALYPRQERAT